MKCEECTTNALEEFLDGELDARRAAQLSAHLAACHVCALRYDELLDEQTTYAAYERDVQVTPQMWAGVAARIATEEKPQDRENFIVRLRAWFAASLVAPRFSPVLTAALVLFAIGATATVMKYLDTQTGTPTNIAGGQGTTATPEQKNVVQPAPGATPDATPSKSHTEPPIVAANGQADERQKSQQAAPQRRRSEAERKPALNANDAAQTLIAIQQNEQLRRQRATARLVQEAESKYVAAIKLLSEDVNRKRTRLDPQVAARFDETLAAIDRSIAETRRTVLQQRNSDPVAVQYMLSAYAKKVEVMREMAAVD
ncbi:MAG TPA: zf-HC2 domain-containing protein [Pyrinomonadaceae bacterium]|nr:zf-HC2 domain-containing protein [Pyrinomonadaceae bacterium]